MNKKQKELIAKYLKAIERYEKYVKIDCSFTNGVCKCGLNYGCCGNCAWNRGFRPDVFTYKDKLLFESLWDNNYGFWSKTGCKLPREKRSLTCRLYFCNDAINPKKRKLYLKLYRCLFNFRSNILKQIPKYQIAPWENHGQLFKRGGKK